MRYFWASNGNRAIYAFAFLAFVAYLILRPPFPFLQTDSASFIEFASSRTAAYPLFLKLIHAIFGDYRPAIYIQLAAMVGATGFLANEIRLLTRSALLGVITVALVLANVYIIRYAFSIMSEAPFFAGVSCVVAFGCRYARTRGLADLVWLSATIGICILIRPIAYSFLPVLVACIVISTGEFRFKLRSALAAVLPVAGMLILGSIAYFAYHGSFRTQSFLGHNLIGKIAYLPGASVRSDFPAVVERIDKAMALYRSVTVDNWRDRYLYRERHYDYVRFGLTNSLIEKLAHQNAVAADDIRQAVALAFIRAHPREYAAEVLLQAYSIWQLADLRTPREKAAFDRFIQGLPFDPFAGMNFMPRKPAPAYFVHAVRLFLGSIFAATVLTLMVGAYYFATGRSFSPRCLAMLQAALILHSYFLCVALVQFGHTRYFMVMWPAVVTIAVVSLSYLPRYAEQFTPRLRKRIFNRATK